MANPTIVVAQLSDEQLKKSIDQMVSYFNKQLNDMVSSADKKVNEINSKLSGIKLGTGSGSANTTNTKNTNKALEEQSVNLDKTSNALDTATKKTQKYSEEVRKLAEEIRKSKSFQETGTWHNEDYSRIVYDPATTKRPKKERQSVEEQVLHILREEEAVKERMRLQELAEAAEKNRSLQKATEQLGIEQQITQEQSKRTSQPKNFDSYTSLRESIAQTLGIQQHQVTLANTETASFQKLNETLGQLTQTYNRLSASERESPQGKVLIESIHEVERALQNIRAQAARPVSLKNILDLQPKTLDDIAYKIRQLQAYKQGIDLTKPGAENEIKKVDDNLTRLEKDLRKYMGTSKQVNEINNALTRSWNYMKNRLAFYFTIGASTQFAKSLIEVRGQYELLERSIGILIDSAQNGTKIFAELNSMALKSPFTTMELGAAAKQLVAYNVAAKDVVDTTRRLADMAAAVGIPIERLTYALGQIKAYGYLNARDARMFANAGIPLVKELADRYTELEGRIVSTADVYDRIKKKAISYEDVMATVNKMTDEGGRFFNFQEKAADTLKVKIANLTLAWNNMLNEIGKDQTGVLNSLLGGTKKLFDNWRNIYNILLSIIPAIGVIKIGQLFILARQKEITKTLIAQKTIGNRLTNILKSIQGLFSKIGQHPYIASFAALAFAITKVAADYIDLKRANEAFNKSLADGAEENTKSIEKFFKEYKDQLANIGGANDSDQQKMWERIQEEIEKTVKTADSYVDKLNEIADKSERISAAKGILRQQEEIEKEVQDLANRGTFDLGGGFMDENAAKNLAEVDEELQALVKRFGSLDAAFEHYKDGGEKALDDVLRWYLAIGEAGKELDNFTEKLGKADLSKIMGQGDSDSKLRNLREYVTLIRDAFLATEDGSKIRNEGQILLNLALDKWIAGQAKANHLIEQRTINGRTYTENEIRHVEEQRSAWEKFFSMLNTKDREIVDYAIKTNQLGSQKVQDIWTRASENMQEKEKIAYFQIQDHIDDLRKTPDIIIDVIYRERAQKSTDAQIEDYKTTYLLPKLYENGKPKSIEKYTEELNKNTRKYGRFIKEEGEDNVEWEKRLGERYQDNAKKIKSLTDMIGNMTDATNINTIAQKNELKAFEEEQKTLLEIGKALGFNYDQFKKGSKGTKKDILGEALSKEVQLITDIRKRYEEYMKIGMNSTDALTKATDEYGRSLLNVKNVLAKFGITGLLGKDVAKMDMRTLVENLQQMMSIAQAAGNAKGVEALEKAIASLNVEIAKIDYKKITDGLNNELNKLKEEYELSVALDAEPELGDTFASLFGINTDELPRTFEDLVKKAQKAVNRLFEEEGGYSKFGLESIDVKKLLDKKTFDEWVTALGKDASSDFIKSIESVRKYLVDSRRKEIEETAKEWSGLLEKYAEYEFKRKQIFDEYEKEMAIARKKNASEEILTAIANRRDSRLAELDLNEFMKTPEWITATGNLAGMSKKAIGLLIDEINEYKNTAKYLTPKQIKQLNQALKQLHAEQRKNSPFKSISNMLAEAKERADNFEEEIKKTKKTIDELESKRKGNIADGVTDDETDNALQKAKKRLEDLIKKKKELGKPDSTEWVNSINDVISAVQNAVKVVDDLVKAIGGVNNSDVDKVFSIITQAGQGAAIGAQIGGGWGAVIGGVIGAATGIISSIANSYNEDINNAIKASEDRVKSLELAYIDLDHAINDAYGDAVIGAKRATIANKELQLTELKRQLQLEKSRKAKDRDNDKIRDLQTQIRELEWDIRDAINDIVNDILGISSVGDFAENLVSSMIEAFKNGEDYMKVFGESFDDMIDNMIMKAIASRVIGDLIQKVFDEIKERKVDTISGGKVSGKDLLTGGMENTKWANAQYDRSLLDWITLLSELSAKGIKGAEESLAKAQKMYNDSLALTVDDVDDVREIVSAGKDDVKSIFEAVMEAFGIKYGQNTDKNLSNLQQGIQSITEDTAGAIEAITNGMYQQICLQSTLIAEIKDAVVAIDVDTSIGLQTQMLLQLQSSYQVQQSIRQILEGVLVPSGRAFAVELLS